MRGILSAQLITKPELTNGFPSCQNDNQKGDTEGEDEDAWRSLFVF